MDFPGTRGVQVRWKNEGGAVVVNVTMMAMTVGSREMKPTQGTEEVDVETARCVLQECRFDS